MKNKNLIPAIFIMLFSCRSMNRIEGHKFAYKSKYRILELKFDNRRPNCSIKNTFYCADIAPEYRTITILCSYQRQGNIIFLTNTECVGDSNCKKPLTISVPSKISERCSFLNVDTPSKKIAFGPSYSSSFEEYRLIPNIDVDTLYIIKNKIMLYKRDALANVGFVFK